MIKEFKTFLAVARDGTFTGAGVHLGLTQSAVSAQIKRLEEYLGIELFDRGARAAVLNAHGREMLPQAEELVAMAERMVTTAGAGHISGSLRIGAIASVQQDLLVRALGEFRAVYPEVRVRIVPRAAPLRRRPAPGAAQQGACRHCGDGCRGYRK